MSILQIQLSPSRGTRISFWVQLGLVIFWLLYGSLLLSTENPTDDQNFFHYLFQTLAMGYLLYILANYTPLFGVQAYLQLTPEYLVQKQGLFQAKLALPFMQIDSLHIAYRGLHIQMQDGNVHYLDLAQVKRKADLDRLKEELREAALIHGFAFSQGPALP